MEEYRERHRAAYLARKNLQERNNNQQSEELNNSTTHPPAPGNTQAPTSSPQSHQSQPTANFIDEVNAFNTVTTNGVGNEETLRKEQERSDEELAQQLQQELNEPTESVRPPDNSYSEQLIGSGLPSNDSPNRSSYYNEWNEGPVHVNEGFMTSDDGNSRFFHRQVFSSVSNSQLFPSNNSNNPLVVDVDETHSEPSTTGHPIQPQPDNSQNDPISIEEEVEIEDDPDTAMLQAAIAKSLVEM